MDSAYTILGEQPNAVPAMRSHHSLSRREIFQNLANRIIYSKFYMVLYLVMAILSIWSIFLSIQQGCSSSALFIVLESIINGTMIAEVALRLTALGRTYWRSSSNILDIILVIFCFITLILILQGCGSGHEAEKVLDTVFLILRNVVQFWRLFIMIRKNSLIANPRVAAIDFDNVNRPESFDIEGFGADAYVDDDTFLADESDDGL
ncbi:hypothetical protein BX616_007792 [Lobosporangium transversale]|uniref:Ion transport domain-containing protein n=1 Tax=Lobosporangium transversale TaxID=64571 RepID=A0A1Y2GVF4_9FUNG|nr:hypothetical protein BCR41DRAFT_420462 [Lobosporangium transversale]KAF9914679.1 hypothetical protein BX616_007792 [Lobosporangium transversale]ORZ22684.1 hypothetical protein BCR41DRAFT_420462 [Lobosporangium transversale]|eukprot:XP_021883238.1 hypothetical protein BCR41DRAFT_420462 [Lobosporangium transversale]